MFCKFCLSYIVNVFFVSIFFSSTFHLTATVSFVSLILDNFFLKQRTSPICFFLFNMYEMAGDGDARHTHGQPSSWWGLLAFCLINLCFMESFYYAVLRFLPVHIAITPLHSPPVNTEYKSRNYTYLLQAVPLFLNKYFSEECVAPSSSLVGPFCISVR